MRIFGLCYRGAAKIIWAVRRKWLQCRVGCTIPASTSIAWTARLYRGGTIVLGDRVTIADGVILAPYGGTITISDKVYLGPYTVVYGHGGVRIGRNTLIAAHTVIIPANHIYADPHRPINSQGEVALGIEIGEDVWLGAGVRVLDGVSVGDGSVVGAGAVVTRSVPPLSIAVGVPARVVRERGQIFERVASSETQVT